MIKDKNSGELRDFAFIEFFTLEDANYVMKMVKKSQIKINNYPVYVTYSRIKKGDLESSSLLVNLCSFQIFLRLMQLPLP
jgi:hypothetical protein